MTIFNNTLTEKIKTSSELIKNGKNESRRAFGLMPKNQSIRISCGIENALKGQNDGCLGSLFTRTISLWVVK